MTRLARNLSKDADNSYPNANSFELLKIDEEIKITLGSSESQSGPSVSS